MLVRIARCRPSCIAFAHFRPRTQWQGLRKASDLSFPEIDAKWQKRWEERHFLHLPHKDAQKKSYVLPMFAYPSGSLHMGHVRVYTISDVIARYRRMNGYKVLHPTGWDAFGLPAENAAIERGIDPAVWTEQNIQRMKQQLKSMNTIFNWDAEFSTSSPSFYKHTQKLFLMLYKEGLAYRADALVNYDPVDKTVLANEQVDGNGRSWRSGAVVEKIKLCQWFFKITDFAPQLLEGLDQLSKNKTWPERVLTQQRNWLGRSDGASIAFKVHEETERIHVFTTRPDTVFGVKYLALSMEHPIVQDLAQKEQDLEAFLAGKASFEPDSKAGYLLPIAVCSPVNTEIRLPVYVAPYVLDTYGLGAVMGVPAHDNRDLAFWKHHRPEETVPIVISPPGQRTEKLHVMPVALDGAYTGRGELSDLCRPYNGMSSREATEQLFKDFAASSSIRPETSWKLRDWLVSRQRYWGTPIPIIHCRACGAVPVPDEDLPVILPKLDGAAQDGKGNPLEHASDWVNCQCPKCQQPARRETDTMDTFVDSSWYFTRFPDAQNKENMFSTESANAMLPVDTYIGGVEHAILHLLYARFIYKFLAMAQLIPRVGRASVQNEPFLQLIAQGMVHGKTFSDSETGRFLLPHEVKQHGDTVNIKASGESPTVTWEKMSKSKHNGVDPSICISKYGADATRAHILFAAPVGEVLQWDEHKIVGIQRWFGRVQRVVSKVKSLELGQVQLDSNISEANVRDNNGGDSLISPDEGDLLILTLDTLQSVTSTMENDIYGLNTTVSDLIKLTNALDDADLSKVRPDTMSLMVTTLLRMLAPIAPAFSEQCWEDLGMNPRGYTGIHENLWPQSTLSPSARDALMSRKTVTCAVQINGKLRFTVEVPSTYMSDTSGASEYREKEILDTIRLTDEGSSWLMEKNDWEKRKRVVVARGGRLVNIVF